VTDEPFDLPDRAAIVEHDGIVSTRYHRGAYVEPFDAPSILDDFEILGHLSGIAVSQLAAKQDGETIAVLQRLVEQLRATDPDDHGAIFAVVRETSSSTGPADPAAYGQSSAPSPASSRSRCASGSAGVMTPSSTHTRVSFAPSRPATARRPPSTGSTTSTPRVATSSASSNGKACSRRSRSDWARATV
jgi:hypothetical protein